MKKLTITHAPDCRLVELNAMWDGILGNQAQDCDCGGYQRAVEEQKKDQATEGTEKKT